MMLQIAVVGTGTAGAAAATLLARAGHAVTVLERVADPKPIGAGITLQPTGFVALARLGLFQQIAARAARIERLTVTRKSGKPLVDLPYADVDPRLYGLGTHRGVLFETLLRALRTTPAKLDCGVHVVSTDIDARGRWIVDDRARRCGRLGRGDGSRGRRAGRRLRPGPSRATRRRKRCSGPPRSATRASTCGSSASPP